MEILFADNKIGIALFTMDAFRLQFFSLQLTSSKSAIHSLFYSLFSFFLFYIQLQFCVRESSKDPKIELNHEQRKRNNNRQFRWNPTCDT